jgi:hypothetical protein
MAHSESTAYDAHSFIAPRSAAAADIDNMTRIGGHMRTQSQSLLGTCIFLALTATAFAGEARPLSIGINFTGSSYGIDSFNIPPDTDGAVGHRHIVELINGHYAVYLKKDGTRVQSTSLDQFWRGAGVSPSGFLTDPRVLFDPFSRRWFASTFSVNFGNGPDDLLLTVSNGADPTQGWTGFTVPFAGPVGNFVDFPTLGFDRDGVFLVTNGTVLVVPKSDLLAAPPTLAHATLVQSRDLLTPTGGKIQPVVNLNNTGVPERLLGTWDVEGTLFRRWKIVGQISAPVLDASDGFIPVTPYASMGNVGAPQPDSGVAISTLSDVLTSSVVLRNSVIWGVETVFNQSRHALRWFAIDANTNSKLQEGLIADPVRDLYMGSIAANGCNDVVIGFNASSSVQFASAYAVAGTTVKGVTTFGQPLLLKSGVARYEQTGGGLNARWGDYSTTVVDPRHRLRFWTFQEWVSAESVWSTQITELKFGKPGHEHDESEETDDGDNAGSADRPGSRNKSDEAESSGCSEDTSKSI